MSPSPYATKQQPIAADGHELGSYVQCFFSQKCEASDHFRASNRKKTEKLSAATEG
jgi:hypothetical protein